jgi:hypothetical protein
VSAGNSEDLTLRISEQYSLIVTRKVDGFMFEAIEGRYYAVVDLSTEDTALLVEWLRDRIEGTD